MKYKYYFKKPRSEIVKDIFSWLALAGMVYIAASSPYFVWNLMRNYKRWQKYRKKSKNLYNAFWRLQNKVV